MPRQEATLSIPLDSLMSLPPGAIYQRQEGQASATVALRGDRIEVTATTPHLQRTVEEHVEQHQRSTIRADTAQHTQALDSERRTTDSTTNKVIVLVVALLSVLGARAILRLSDS